MATEETLQWLRMARDDLAAARMLRKEPRLGHIAAFHFQQAAEKAIKGMLVVAGVAPPRSHDLGLLLTLHPDPGELSLDAADVLTPFAVLARYPGFETKPEDELLEQFDVFASDCVDLFDKVRTGSGSSGLVAE